MFILNYIQFTGLLFAISLRWPWPESVMTSAAWISAFNMDIWFISFVYSSGWYKAAFKLETKSSLMPLKYWHLMLAWAIVIVTLVIVFVVIFVNIWPRHRGLLKRIYVSIIQAFAIPLCTCFARVWQCNVEMNMDVENSENCWKGPHVAFYCVPSLMVFLIFMVIVPYILISRSYQTIHSSSEYRHEQALKQIELEKASNVSEPPMHIYLVATLRRKGRFFKGSFIFVFTLFSVFYASLFENTYGQALAVTIFLWLLSVILIILRPFRVTIFNVYAFISYLILAGLGITGCMLTSGTSSVWLTPTYLEAIITVSFVLWLLLTLVIFIYIFVKLCFAKKFKDSMWPSMILGENSLRFLESVRLATKCLSK